VGSARKVQVCSCRSAQLCYVLMYVYLLSPQVYSSSPAALHDEFNKTSRLPPKLIDKLQLCTFIPCPTLYFMYNLQSQRQYAVHIGEECSPLQRYAWHMDLALLLPLAYLQTQTYKFSCSGSLALIRCALQCHSSQHGLVCMPLHPYHLRLSCVLSACKQLNLLVNVIVNLVETRKLTLGRFFAVAMFAYIDASSAAQSPATTESCLCRCMQHVQLKPPFCDGFCSAPIAC